MKKQRLNISKLGFLLSVMGSAVGLGGIWGFPTQMYNHHGAFLIPFIICMVICAIPVLFIEITIGNKYRKNHIEFFNKKGAFFAWLHSATVILLSTYYSVLVSWTLINIGISFTNNLNHDSYFYHDILQVTSSSSPTSFAALGSLNWMVLLATLGVWIILLGGVEKEIEKANKVFIPFLFLMIIVLVIYTSTLSGAKLGLNVMFNLDGKDLLTPSVWKDAFGQAFFMLSTCTGTIYIYAAHAPQKQDSTNQAFVVAFGTTVIGILTAMIVFNAMGAIAYNKGETNLDNIFHAGPALIFQVIPQLFGIINSQVAVLGNVLAILFFVTLFFVGMSSLIGQVESMVNGLEYEIHLQRKKALALLSLLGAMLISVLFTFNKSPFLFDGLGIWVAQIWLLIIGFILLVGISPWGWNLYDSLKQENNENSWIKWNKGYTIVILIVAPILILVNIGTGIYDFIINTISSPFFYGVIGVTLGIGLTLALTFALTYHKAIHETFKKIVARKTKSERG
ncbi:sodium-dependent transporter [Spiroplasma endosymbiont of Nebria brevicollis]|uniref:sodium-dependent transporter n=1 Tax=Spiroplasma endosymbiont of Nebria brevicollis TaxID=3066284 RepID=UPI00313E1FF9